MKLKSRAELNQLRKLYRPIDAIGDEYARALKRQCAKMKRIMMGVYRQKVAPIIREYEARKAKILKANSQEVDLQRLLKRYMDLAEAEIAAAMIAIEDLWEPAATQVIAERFSDAVSRAQRQILLQEILEEAGQIDPAVFDALDDGADDIAEEYADNNLDFLPETLPVEYGERVREGVIHGIRAGLGIAAIAALIGEYGAMADNRADFIAHDQTGRLYEELCQKRQTNIGVNKFMWVTLHGTGGDDGRVRPKHLERNGKIYSWTTGANGEYPGEPYGCRCRARAVIE